MFAIRKEVTYRVDGEEVTTIVYSQCEYQYIIENFDLRRVKDLGEDE